MSRPTTVPLTPAPSTPLMRDVTDMVDAIQLQLCKDIEIGTALAVVFEVLEDAEAANSAAHTEKLWPGLQHIMHLLAADLDRVRDEVGDIHKVVRQ